MATAEKKRKELLDFLDKKVFDPILKASPDDYTGEHKQKILGDVKRKTESEKHRFHENYTTAEEVKENFQSDLSSKSAKKVDKELDELGLPTLPGVKQDFMKLCDKLGV